MTVIARRISLPRIYPAAGKFSRDKIVANAVGVVGLHRQLFLAAAIGAILRGTYEITWKRGFITTRSSITGRKAPWGMFRRHQE